MSLRDRAIEALRSVFGAEREARASAESPSAAAAAAQPSSIYAAYGRDEIAGMLSVSQSLIDRFADYESMEEYPDIGCVAGDTMLTVCEGAALTVVSIEDLVKTPGDRTVLGFDVERRCLTKVTAEFPRLTNPDAETVLLDFGGRKLRCTPDHKLLTPLGYIEAKDLRRGDKVVGTWTALNPGVITITPNFRPALHELLADPTPAGRTRVFDITTATHNFVANGLVIHNSTFRYFAHDATKPNVKNGRTVWAVSDDRAIQGICDDLLKKVVKVEDESSSQAYSLCMMGNDYSELLVNESGVVGINHLPAATMRRVEALDGGLIGYVQDVTGQFTANNHELRSMLSGSVEIPPTLALFEDWQVIHMRLRMTRRRSPYGVSVAEGARWIWKRLVMLEDVAVIYRLNRIPRYIYRVDVTDVPPAQVESHLRKMKRDLRKKRYVNPRTGRFDMRYGAFAQDEDFVVAVREGRELAGVDIISAPDWNSVEDLDYFKRMMHGTLNVPRAWLGQDEPIPGKQVLSNEDVRAAFTTLNVQREMRNGYERMCRVHLAARGVANPWSPELEVQMTIPSGIWELVAFEVLNAQADYAARVMPYTSIRWIQENVLKFDEDTIKAIKKQKKEEMQDGNPFAGMMGGMPGMGGPPGMPGAPPQPGREPSEAPPGARGAEDEEPVVRPVTPSEWKAWDQARRLEEWRHKQSTARHQELIDKLGQVLERQGDAFARREYDRREFFHAIKAATSTSKAGRVIPLAGTGGWRSRNSKRTS